MLVHASLDQILGVPCPGAGGEAGETGRTDEATGTGKAAATTGWSPVGPGTAGAFAAGRAAGDGEPGWLATPAAAQAYACDAKIATVVTGHLDPEVVAAAVRAYLARQDHPTEAGQSWLRATLVRYATAMLSGPAGLASALRSGLPGPLGAAVSLPLDITSPTATVPPHLRRAVIVRDRHCAFPGCHQPPARSQVHHVIPRSRGGPTALHNLVLLCAFHHLHLIHRQGWTLVLNADGTTTAASPGGRRILHSHAPPAAAA